MKKITTYFFMCMLMLSSAAFANSFTNGHGNNNRHGNPDALLSVPFFSEDFASGLPGTWLNVDNGSAANVLWRYTQTGTANGIFDSTLSTVGTSAQNGFMIFDSDSAGGGGGEDASLITPIIDCSLFSNVHLTWNEYFAQYNVSMGIVSVSNDGGSTWTDIHHAEAGLASEQTTPNPSPQDYDITAIAAGQPSVMVQFRWIGDFEYFWMVDDVTLYEVAATDGGVLNITAPLSSCSHLSNAENVTVEIKNFANADLSNFLVSYVADNGAAITDTVTDTIAPGGTLSYTFLTPADLSLPGQHNILAYTTVLNDGDNANDQFSVDLFVGPHNIDQATPYTQGFEPTEDQSGWTAIDTDVDGTTWGLSNVVPRTGTVCATYTHELPTNQANDYYFSTCLGLSDTSVYQLDFYYRNFSPGYQANMEVILCTSPDPSTIVATLVPTMLVNTAIWTLSSSSIFVANGASGNYYIGWHVTHQDSSTSLKIDDINIYYSGPNSISLQSNATIALYPNPSDGLVRISGLNEQMEISVYDMVGKMIHAQTVNADNQMLDLRKQPNGVYSVVMRSEKSSFTKQLILTGN